MAQRAAHSVHSMGQKSEALIARPQLCSFIDRHLNPRIVFDRKNSIEPFASIELFVSIDASCLRYWHC